MMKSPKNNSIKLSIVILSYNTKDLLKSCIQSIESVNDIINKEIIVVDNGSIDQSINMVKNNFHSVIMIENKDNLGFAKGNNVARKLVKGEYVLFLNSDTEVSNGCFDETIKYLENNKEVGALSCKTILPNGNLDLDARRSFPTPWVALSHFSYLDRIFPQSKIFAQYWYGYRSSETIQEVDVIQGAFFLTRKDILDQVDWFDESYFLDGEDIDLCWKIKKAGFKIIYYPKVSILHVKKASKRKNKNKSTITGLKSMEMFYKKRMWNENSILVNYLVLFGIKVLSVIRVGKRKLLG